MLRMSHLMLALLTASALSVLSCNNSPTVPLPPPDMTEVSHTPPDEDGFVMVTGGPESAEPDSVVLLFNETQGHGVMETAEENGAFEASVLADPGNSLELRLKDEDKLSKSKYIVVTEPQQ